MTSNTAHSSSTSANGTSPIFQAIEKAQGDQPWGSFLDAGTGRKSIEWISRLDTERWTAVTASQEMARTTRKAAGAARRRQDRILVGNWMSDQLLFGERFDTVLLDYFIGAIEGFAPYWQDRALHRLRPHVGDRLYLVGVEPYVLVEPKDEAGALVREIGRLRDACLLIAGNRPYREYPSSWVMRQLGIAGFRVLDVRYFPIHYRERFVNGQLDLCLRQLPHLSDEGLAKAMHHQIEALREHALPLARSREGLKHGSDYLIVAEPMADRHRGLHDPPQPHQTLPNPE
ncbi:MULTISPECIES: class I SAM-dependent methyltransferase [unclassified Thioalkalivibrio]|uniref:class I SAM-dependent methyltransferase n=1 Tax=unclassified Thioalkalivibrio TaxID=2621013 RepID=UPI00037390B3|nr:MULTISPECIES: class I SAM-dependent methyltransferase [unclassified Thioalkalivibrio]